MKEVLVVGAMVVFFYLTQAAVNAGLSRVFNNMYSRRGCSGLRARVIRTVSMITALVALAVLAAFLGWVMQAPTVVK